MENVKGVVVHGQNTLLSERQEESERSRPRVNCGERFPVNEVESIICRKINSS